VHRFAVEPHHAGGWFGQARHDVQQCGLAASGGADQGCKFALADRKRDVAECGAAMRAETLFEPIDR
jgi:hypothetical protein